MTLDEPSTAGLLIRLIVDVVKYARRTSESR